MDYNYNKFTKSFKRQEVKQYWLIISLFLLCQTAIASPQQTVTGRVVDENNMPIPGTTVQIKGTTTGVATNMDGEFSLEARENDVLVFSFIGFRTQEVEIQGREVVNVTMEEDPARLDEVIVTGYMKQKKADLTGAVATASSEEIEKNSYTNVMQGLQGRLPGVRVTGDGSPTGNVGVQIRGITSMRSLLH